jgi:phage putative head morphogenesis protein, SPP1 gp7 family
MDKKKLTPEQQFFNDKTLEFAEEIYNKNEEKLLEAYKGQIKNRDDLLSKIAKILLSYNIADNILKINATEKKLLYSELSDLIVSDIKSELDFETNLTKDILTSVGKEKFNTNNYIYSLGADFNLTQLSDEALEKIINRKVDDKLWSDRLYTNKNDMCMTLQDEIEKFLKGETNVNQIEQKIIDRYDTNKYETERLVQDNICRVQEGANDVWQQEHGIKKVMYMATLDGKVCSKCAQFDTKVFDIDKKPVEIPQHPFCRCVYISLVNENWRPKMRLDNETKENINWQSYEEWKKNYIDNNPERLTNHKMIKNKSSDKRIYEKYKDILGKEMPKTLEDFQKLKYNNIEKWNELKNRYSEVFVTKDFNDIAPRFKEKLSNLETRKWYKWHDENIPNLIDRTISIEEQAKQAHNFRNTYRTQARDLMKDQDERKKLDLEHPNISFDKLIESKMTRKNMTREEAVKDVLKTATKTNKEVNKSLGLE